jgi:hypothetical protein
VFGVAVLVPVFGVAVLVPVFGVAVFGEAGLELVGLPVNSDWAGVWAPSLRVLLLSEPV